MLKDSKAQTEIFGLIIIVVIITFVIVFTLLFFAKPKSFYVGNERILAANWMEATLAMHTTCGGRTMEDLLKDCAQSVSGGALCPDDKQGKKLGTCETAQEIINDVISKTFKEWQINHRLLLNGSSSVEELEFPCNFTKCQKIESAFRSVPVLGGSEFSVIMQICRDISGGNEVSC